MKKLFSAILSTALVFSTVAGAAASDISLTAKSCIVKSDDDTDNVFVSENFSSYTPGENLIVADGKGKVSFTATENLSVRPTKSNAYTADNFIGFVADPTGSNNGNVLKLQADNQSVFPVVRYDKGINTSHNKSKMLSVKASLFIDKDTAEGLFVGEDYNVAPQYSRLDAETMGFMSVWTSHWNDGKRQYAIGTLAFDNTKVSKTDGSYTFDGKTIPAYINAPNTISNSSYDSTQNTAQHLADVTLPVGEWFDVEFVYDLPKATANTSENGSVPMTVYIAGNRVYSGSVIIPKESEANAVNNFYNVYRGVAFSPNAYINADSKGETKPIMYVDNIEAKYFSEKLVDEDFSNGYALNTNFNTEKNKSGNSNFTIRVPYGNSGAACTDYSTDNSISIVNEAQGTNKVLKLTSSTDSIFPVVSYVPSKDTVHQENKQLVVKANLFFDKNTVAEYKLKPDPNASPWRMYDKANMGFVSVFGTYSDWSSRSNAMTTIAYDTSKSSDWTDYSYIPAYINAPNTKGNSKYSDSVNTGEHLADVKLPTGKWFEVKFVYDLPSATDNTTANGTVPFTVYIDGTVAYTGDAILPQNSAFATSYQGIAFSPNAYMAEGNKSSVSPTMYVDNIAAYYTVAEEYLKFDISNTANEEKTFTLIAAFYNADGSLDNVVIKDEYKVGASTTVTDTFKLNDVELSSDVSTVRLFAWDNFTDMQPLAPLAELTVD